MTKQITKAPLPQWKHLLKVILDFDSVDDDKILAPWLKGEDFGFLLSRSAWSLSIIAQIRHLITQSEVCVWLPDYFCNSSIAPLRELNTNLVFYPIHNDGSPNIKVCNELLNLHSKPDLFIAVHYFGYLVDLEERKDEYEPTHRSILCDLSTRHKPFYLDNLIDSDSVFLELGKFAAYDMYQEYGKIPAAGVVIGLGKLHDQECMIIGNDATVKAGAYFELTLKKTLRAQKIALENNIPIIYLVDSAGVFLPLQDQVFPDENHFGKIFYNNAIISSKGIPQIACVMGPCVAGGAYLPVMCDKYIIVDGASMFLAGPALVKAAIGQEIDEETLGGSNTHAAISGTADYKEKDDYAALSRIRKVISNINFSKNSIFIKKDNFKDPDFPSEDLLGLIDPRLTKQYDMKEIIARIVDESDFDEYKKDYGKTLICGTGRLGGYNIGIVSTQRLIERSGEGAIHLGGVIYSDSADKAARFIMNCNQDKIPILFIHDVNGFMVGKHSEWSGIAKDGAKLVNAVSNCKVPKISSRDDHIGLWIQEDGIPKVTSC